MKAIRCENIIKTEEGKDQKCGRILAVLTDAQVDFLRIDPEGGPILRCPKCHPEQRWIKIYSNDGKLVFETLGEHQEFKDNLVFDELIVCNQVG
jgi:hypothetical protein